MTPDGCFLTWNVFSRFLTVLVHYTAVLWTTQLKSMVATAAVLLLDANHLVYHISVLWQVNSMVEPTCYFKTLVETLCLSATQKESVWFKKVNLITIKAIMKKDENAASYLHVFAYSPRNPPQQWALFMKYVNCTYRLRTNASTSRCFVHS